MKILKSLFIFAFLALYLFSAFPNTSLAVVRVNGYTRKDGTYVAPHYRSDPDGNVYNNWSTKGNVNPYTGKEGTVIPHTTTSTYSAPKTNTYKALSTTTRRTTQPRSGTVKGESTTSIQASGNSLNSPTTKIETPPLPTSITPDTTQPSNSENTLGTLTIWSVLGIAVYMVVKKKRPTKDIADKNE